jgi:hypothetical protein
VNPERTFVSSGFLRFEIASGVHDPAVADLLRDWLRFGENLTRSRARRRYNPRFDR